MKNDPFLTKMLDGIVGIVEANSFETMCLWKEYHKEDKHSWEQGREGTSVIVGQIGDMPVCVSLYAHKIKGHKILFIEATSMVVDHRMIEDWLLKNVPETALKPQREGDPKRYLNKENAMNFHNVFPYEMSPA